MRARLAEALVRAPTARRNTSLARALRGAWRRVGPPRSTRAPRRELSLS